MEDFYFEENNSKNAFFKCLIYLFVIGIAIGVFLYYKKQNTLKLNNVVIEVGSSLSNNIEDYIKNGHKFIDEYKLYLDKVDINTVGEYSYKIKYNKHTKIGKVSVVDTTKPIANLDNITIGIDEEFNPNILLESCEDYSLPCNVEFKNESDKKLLNKIGSHKIDFYISDLYGNKTLKSTIITVSDSDLLSSKMTNDLDYYTNSENDDTINHVFFKKFNSAILEDTLEFEGIIQEISTIDFADYVDKEIYSTKLITVYNKYGYVIGIQVEVTFIDGTKQLLEDYR